mmetsp:Transcript_14230/g.42431  ORF Transcript_14230/g.42431 Transcript_14230/m.42431 type:complete len:88 (-) Transcript_14230:193-456(-)
MRRPQKPPSPLDQVLQDGLGFDHVVAGALGGLYEGRHQELHVDQRGAYNRIFVLYAKNGHPSGVDRAIEDVRFIESLKIRKHIAIFV